MKTAEKIIVGLAILGIALRLAFIPGGAILSILALGILGMFYFAAGFFLFDPTKQKTIEGFQYKTTNGKRAFLAIFTGAMLSLAPIGILFKLMHWPGALAMILITLVTTLPIFVLSVVKLRYGGEAFYKQIALRTGIFSMLAFAIFMMAVIRNI